MDFHKDSMYFHSLPRNSLPFWGHGYHVIWGIWALGFLFLQKQNADPGCPFWMTWLSQSKQTQRIDSPWPSRYGMHMLPEVEKCLTTMLFVHKALCYLTFSNGSHHTLSLSIPNIHDPLPPKHHVRDSQNSLSVDSSLFSHPHSS
jgi:hypothetical protein